MKFCSKITHRLNSISNPNDEKMPLAMRNYVIALVGLAVVVAGFLLMSGGTKATPEHFDYDIFSFRRITLAPIVVVAGFAIEIYAILRR